MLYERGLTTEERFWSKVDIKGKDDCWEWTKHVMKHGYGLYSIGKTSHITAHRMAWIATYGDIPKGLEVCHTCANRKCANPNHLYLATHFQNMKELRIRNLNNESYGEEIKCPVCMRAWSKEEQYKLTNNKLFLE